MKVKVLKNTFDTQTKKRFKKGDVIELSKERAQSGIKRGLIEEVKTEKKEGKPKTSKKEKK